MAIELFEDFSLSLAFPFVLVNRRHVEYAFVRTTAADSAGLIGEPSCLTRRNV